MEEIEGKAIGFEAGIRGGLPKQKLQKTIRVPVLFFHFLSWYNDPKTVNILCVRFGEGRRGLQTPYMHVSTLLPVKTNEQKGRQEHGSDRSVSHLSVCFLQ